jgi:S-DNA-T family DNA segregation ATPase FtsK/SpoIIIE
MAGVTPKRKSTPTHSRRRELLGLLLLALGLLFFFALCSYEPHDPSFNATGHGAVKNWIGPLGAYFADLTHQLLGIGAYCVAWIPVAFGVAVLIGRDLRHVLLRLAAFVLLALSASALAQFCLAGKSGGWIGALLVTQLGQAVGQVGAAIVLITLFIALVVATLNVSFVRMTGTFANAGAAISRTLHALVAGVLARTRRAWSARTKEKTVAVKEAKRAEKISALEERLTKHEPKPAPKPKRPAPPKPAPIEDDEPEEIGELSVASDSKELGEWPDMPEVLQKAGTWENDDADLVLRAAQGPLIVDPRPDTTPVKASQPTLPFATTGTFELPPISLLNYDAPERVAIDSELLLQNAKKLERKLKDYGIDGTVVEIRPGPVVTMYEFLPAAGVKVSKIASLTDDLAMAMEAMRVRIVAPIPGKGVVGIEIPNERRETVYLKEIISHDDFMSPGSFLKLAIGKDIEGKPYVTDLAKCPHLLVAGATGSGKSVTINSIVLSLLYRATPEDVRLIMVDPKMLELSVYEGIPHLLLPVVTDPKKAALALRWAVEEMERRYALLSEAGVRNIGGYNKKLEKNELKAAEGAAPPVKLPYIVVLIDELADLMMVASREVETSICRLAQMARAAGIHLILATQRPSVDVITGVIKANFPARMSFQVTSRHDSRTILDGIGAENLLGMGDMLFMQPGGGISRVHGAYLSEVEIERVTGFLKKQGKPTYDESILRPRGDEDGGGEAQEEYEDELYDQAVAVVSDMRQASVSMIQRRMRIGYNRAARLIERMEREGIVGPGDGAKPREVLVQPTSQL